jgi:hypothetical protein
MTHDAALSLLLAEEFDSRPTPPPDIEALLDAARAQARAEACAACDARATEARQALAGACASLASGMAGAMATLDAELTRAARAMAEAMIAAIGAALPGWQARLGPGAMAEIATTLLASLAENAAPRLAAAPAEAGELRELLPAEITVDADPATPPGGLRLAWRGGRAVRDPERIWNEIETILTSALPPPPGPSSEPQAAMTE